MSPTRVSLDKSGAIAPSNPISMTSIRGVWITNVDSRILDSSHTIRESVQRLADIGINTLFPVVWNRGYTLYPSQVMGDYFGTPGNPEIAPAFTERDPLAEILAIAQPLNLRVIPWFEYGFASAYRQNGGRILAQYPDWAGCDRHGGLLTKNGFEWLNALDDRVQDFMLQLMLEVLTHYPVDGVQGNDRLPGFPVEGGYDRATQNLYYRETGREPPKNPRDPDWMKWRSDRLTQFLHRLYDQVKAVRPGAIVSMAPSPYPFGYEEYLQDIPTWIRHGLVDWLHPQLYRRTFKDYRRMVDAMLRYCTAPDGSPGILLAPGMLVKSGSYLISGDDLTRGLQYNHQTGLAGEVFFFAEAFFQNQGSLGTQLRNIRPGQSPKSPFWSRWLSGTSPSRDRAKF